MIIKNLNSISFEEVMQCFLFSFENYFVQLPADKEYWRKRFVLARVNWELSFGMFDNDKLVAFIIHGIDYYRGKRTAYNTGTGVLPDYRGQGLLPKLYDFAIPVLVKKGVERCLLEVIVENEAGIKAYQKSNFRITRQLRSFGGVLAEDKIEQPEECSYQKILELGLYRPEHYSWDNAAEAIRGSQDIRTFITRDANHKINGYFSLDESGNILQMENLEQDYKELLSMIAAIKSKIRIKNIFAERRALISELEKRGFVNSVNQYEMELSLPK